ncbi:tetratricopeptide repeat protein [Rhodopila globiformis]|nr:tetratricopeptide repeat protein [Rhodopila globiformis]
MLMDSTERLASALRLLESGCWQQAAAAAQAVLAADPDDVPAARLSGLAIAAMGEADRAAPLLARAAARPDARHPCLDLAALTPPLPHTLVVRQFRACLALSPSDHRLRRIFAEYLLDSDDDEAAEAVLADMPGDAVTHHLKGMARAAQGRYASAIGSFKLAVALDPGAAASWSNLGIVLKADGQFQRAIAAHDRAVTLQPDNPQFRVNRAVALLHAGAWEQAWPDFEHRLDLVETPGFDRARLMPSLAAGDSLAGRTILALHEDGFGDTLQFLRYLPLLAERGATVIACVPPALERVMRLVPGVAAVVTDAGRSPAHDHVCPMFSLPRVFGSTIDTIPPVPRLAFDPPPRPSGTQPRVGLVWAGQARPYLPGFRALDRQRSAGLAAFAPLAALTGVRFVSLQMGPTARQPAPPGLVLEDAMAEVTDFLDTARVIAGLDAVVSVDTSVVHLAGLVGKPVLLLDRYDGCWRWLYGRADSPWYPNLRIFRQEQPGDWSAPMARIAAALEARSAFCGFVADPT